MSAQLRAPASDTQQPPRLDASQVDEIDGVKLRGLARDDGHIRLDLGALQIAAEPVGTSSTLDQDGQQHNYSSLMKQSSECDDEYFGVVVEEEFAVEGGRGDPVASKTLRGEEGQLNGGVVLFEQQTVSIVQRTTTVSVAPP